MTTDTGGFPLSSGHARDWTWFGPEEASSPSWCGSSIRRSSRPTLSSCTPPRRGRRSRMRHVVESPSGCWVWTGYIHPNGYAHVRIMEDGRSVSRLAHRASYETFVGRIPDGLTIDHLCRNTVCVNPEHLEPVTCSQNLHRSPINLATINAAKTHCPKGHPLSGPNLYVSPVGDRSCRSCRRAANRSYKARHGGGAS